MNVSSDYLTGFSKRKQARRRFGHDMEAFKNKKKLLVKRKERKMEKDVKLKQLEKHIEDDSPKRNTTKVLFDDVATKDRFGSQVVVTTLLGTPEQSEIEDIESDSSIDERVARMKAARQGEKLSLFQQVQKKRKGIALPTRRQKLKQVKQANQFFGKEEKEDGKAAKRGKRRK